MNEPTTNLTPAMRQYMDARQGLPPRTILLFRMGDFYELFFEDAKTAAPVMGVVLTQRSGVPMCGVPYHSVKTYVGRLIAGGYKVALAEQMEDPKLAKGLVKREIVQVITPGTVVDDEVLEGNRCNFLAAICPLRKQTGLAVLDVTTGDFRLTQVESRRDLEIELSRLQPAETLIAASQLRDWEKNGDFPDVPAKMVWTPLEDCQFDPQTTNDRLCRHFEVGSLDGFGCRGLDAAICAAGAALYYAENNLRCDPSHLTTLQPYHVQDCLVMDRISQRNLELVEPIFTGGKGATLLAVLDNTVTPMGGRHLREWIQRPLRKVEAICDRLDAVETFVRDPLLLGELREALAAVRDLERTIMRLNVGSANARDLRGLGQSLAAIPGLTQILDHADTRLLRNLRQRLDSQPRLVELIEHAIVDEPPLTIREGGLIRSEYDPLLEQLRKAMNNDKSWIADLQQQEIQRTGIKSLKIGFNRIFGYFIEITKTNLEQVPADYIRKQTLVNCERFITPELKEMEDKVLGAEEKAKALEYELFQKVRSEAVACTAIVQETARALGDLDAIATLADAACRRNYVRPVITEEPILDIRDGRHPVLDALMTDERFVPNDTCLNTTDNQLAIITGPNMAGKSTYIRQVALIVVMAHMGSFVPAGAATIGIADRIFTRIGAADDIARGQSTFMVEMVETANILNNATPRSLIILDEIGRGTSTFDGLSLAWAIAEFLHDDPAAKARTLFATHYHELTELALTKPGVKNYNIAVREWGEKIIFLRKIVQGNADKSYGIHVARLAGIPKAVIDRSREVLTNLESNEFSANGEPKIAASTKKIRRTRPPLSGNQPSLFEF
jgi:DNA mismatch repair protein MutS